MCCDHYWQTTEGKSLKNDPKISEFLLVVKYIPKLYRSSNCNMWQFPKKITPWENFSLCFNFFASFCSHIEILSSLACFVYWQKTLSPVHSSSQTKTGFKMLPIRKLFYVDWTKATPENVKPITDFCYFLVKKNRYPHQNQSISQSKTGIYSNLTDQCTKSCNEVT